MGNVKSKLWTRWPAPEHRCVVPFRSFSEFNNAVAGDETRPSLCFADIWTNWTSGREVKGGRRDHERALCVTFHGAERGGNSATGYSPGISLDRRRS
jgi:putative SOS response-associated peptidase YedK